MWPNLLDMKLSTTKNNRGFSIIESLLGLAMAVGLGTMVNSTLSSISAARKKTTRMMALDSLERQITSLSDKISIVESSIQASAKQMTPSQANCFIYKVHCESISEVSAVSIPLVVREGGKQKRITGPNAKYNDDGDLCSSNCQVFEVSTKIFAVCQSGKTCASPAFYLVQNSYSIHTSDQNSQDHGEGNAPIRIKTQEVRKSTATKLFPYLTISCPEKDQVLRGISISGKPMCTRLSNMKFEDNSGRKYSDDFKVSSTDCGDQAYVSEILSPSGDVICSPNFW